jgi:hypothetical protein
MHMFQINHLIRSSLISVLLLTASIPVLAVNAGQTARNAAVPDAGYHLPPPELQAVVDAPRGPLFRLGPQLA